MKNLRTLLAVGFLAFMTSCNTTKQTTTDSVDRSTRQTTTKTVEGNRGRSNQDISQNQSTNSRQVSSKRVSSTGTARNNKALSMERNKNMYETLNLDDSQIKRFENDWKNSTNSWKRSNRNKTMNSFERTEHQDRIMKNILDDSQFQAYQEWARENPITD